MCALEMESKVVLTGEEPLTVGDEAGDVTGGVLGVACTSEEVDCV